MEQLLFWVGLAAVAVNAISGVLEAEDKSMDLLGAIMVALATALGGGSLRDVLIDRPVFWIVDQTYLTVGVVAAVATFFWARRRKISPNLILYPDAVGLALFTIIGTQVGLQWEVSWLGASLLGVITGVFGGVLRDVFCNQVPLTFLPSELYATAATFTLLAWGFAFAFAVCQAWYPGSFAGMVEPERPRTWFELLFLSFSTLSSVGIGDILPIGPQARALAMLASFAGVMYIALVVSRLIGLSTLARARSDAGRAP